MSIETQKTGSIEMLMLNFNELSGQIYISVYPL